MSNSLNINTFEKLAESFLDDLTLNNMSSNTIKSYRSDIDHFLRFYISNKILTINEKSIKKYFINMKEHGLSSTTMKRRCASLRGIIGDVFPKSITIKLEKYLPDVLTDDEIRQIESVIDNDRDYAVINLLLTTGIRIAELWALNTDDIKGEEFKVFGKGSKERIVCLTKQVFDKMKNILNRPSQPLICNKNGGRMSMVYIRKITKDIAKEAGVDKHITPHSFRHTFATRLLRKGVPVHKVSKLLGHASVATTERYLHLTDTELVDEVIAKSNWGEVL